jgi:ABC-type sugar transport system ATPase subunit
MPLTVLLSARELSKSFPGVRALSSVSLDLRSGEIHGLVGENGAGKSTFVKLLTGLLEPDDGSISVSDQEVVIRNPIHAEGLGISAVQQEIAVVPELDVATNILLGTLPTRRHMRGFFRFTDKSESRRRAEEALQRLGSTIDVRTKAVRLSTSEAQIVLLARALSRATSIFVLDEPTASLSPVEREELFSRLRTLRDAGLGILYISHHLDEVLALSDRITVFRDGEQVGTYRAAELSISQLIELMTARTIGEMYPKQTVRAGDPVLEVRDLSMGRRLIKVSLTVRSGEIVGVTGLIGAGKSELGGALYGALPVDSGQVIVGGKRVKVRSPRDGLSHGIALVPEDRKAQGLVLGLSVRDNFAVSVLNAGRVRATLLRWRQWVLRRRVDRLLLDFIRRFNIRLRSAAQQTAHLSGGNQQKVVLAKCVATRPAVLILDEPTRGIDVGSKVEIYRMIEQLANEGTGVLLLSSEPEEIIGISDRILVMRKGQIVGSFARDEASRATVMRYATAGAP